MGFFTLSGVAATLNLGINLVDRIRGKETGNKWGLLLEAKKRGYLLIEDKYFFNTSFWDDNQNQFLINVERYLKVRKESQWNHTIHDKKLFNTPYVTQRLKHLLKGNDVRNTSKETFDHRPDCEYPLITHVEENIEKEYHRQTVLQYTTDVSDKLEIQIEIDCPTEYIEANFIDSTGLLHKVDAIKFWGRATFNKNLDSKWIENNVHWQVSTTKLQISSLIQFRIFFDSNPQKIL